MKKIMNIQSNHKYWSVGLAVAFFAVASLAPAQGALAASLNYSVDTYFTLGGKTYKIPTGGQAESVVVGASTITVTTGSGQILSVQSADRYTMNNSQGLPVGCSASAGYVVVPQNTTGLVITPDTATTCNVAPASSGGGGGSTGGGGGSGAILLTTPTTTTTTTTNTTTTTTSPTHTYNPTSPTTTSTSGDNQIATIAAESKSIDGLTTAEIANAVGVTPNAGLEKAATALLSSLDGSQGLSADAKAELTAFIAYGTPSTTKLGVGERAGVLNSYFAAFGALPQTEAEWSDALKIANGRFPSKTSKPAEDRAAVNFKMVYKRTPNMSNANDKAAVNVMAYGLRSVNRNMASEAASVKAFKYAYGRNPSTARDWDVSRAIAYSGAKR